MYKYELPDVKSYGVPKIEGIPVVKTKVEGIPVVQTKEEYKGYTPKPTYKVESNNGGNTPRPSFMDLDLSPHIYKVIEKKDNVGNKANDSILKKQKAFLDKINKKKLTDADKIFIEFSKRLLDRKGVDEGFNSYYKDTKNVSVVDFLNRNKADSSKEYRKKIAKKLGIRDYNFTASDNIELLKRMVLLDEINKNFGNKDVPTFTTYGGFDSSLIDGNKQDFNPVTVG